jgi:uncharacterized membrane protein YqhA
MGSSRLSGISFTAASVALLAVSLFFRSNNSGLDAYIQQAVSEAPADKKNYVGRMIRQGVTSVRVISAINGLCCLAVGASILRKIRRGRPDSTTEIIDPINEVSSGRFVVFVALLTVLGLVVRIPAMRHGMSYDEIFTYQQFVSKSFVGVVCTYFVPNNHILYSIVSHFILRVADWPSDLERIALLLRILPLLAGAAIVPMTYLMARRLLSPVAASLTAVGASICPLLVDFSAQARGHSLGALLAALSTLLFSRLASAGSQWPARFYVICNVLMIYTTPVTALVVVAHGVAASIMSLMGDRRSKDAVTFGKWVLPAAGTLLVASQLYAFVIPQGVAYVRSLSEQGGAASPSFWVASGSLIDDLTFRTSSAAFGVGVAAICLIAVAARWRRFEDRSTLAACVLVAAASVFLGATSAHSESRFVLFASPHFMCLLGVAASSLVDRSWSRHSSRFLCAAAISIVCVVLCWPSLRRQWRTPPQPIREAVAAAYRQSDGSPICALGLAARECRYYENFERPLSFVCINSVELIDVLNSTTDPVWTILTYRNHWNGKMKQAGLSHGLASQTDRAESFAGRIPDGDVTVFLIDPAAIIRSTPGAGTGSEGKASVLP